MNKKFCLKYENNYVGKKYNLFTEKDLIVRNDLMNKLDVDHVINFYLFFYSGVIPEKVIKI